ncbi:hypothetical protein CspeluHIS016_0403750 [Cutaneotrichosporon spelunceum]|uniref:Flo11 domain-containing protein n=1 Tax=Cutaneotrichosporon spelunceum TaxID=1672016 RepID=A0AAD3TVX2_9TREE|nr:hypothetical protein CspeluHIS016_0403750 [Cutaneotrichosporon spelunceum]
MRLLTLLLLPLAFAVPTEEKRTGDHGGGGGDDHTTCTTGRVTSTSTVWSTIPQPPKTTTSTVWGNCWTTSTATRTKTTAISETSTVTKSITTTTYVPGTTPVTTKTVVTTTTTYPYGKPGGKRAAETVAANGLSNADRLQRGLPLRVPKNVAKKRTFDGDWTQKPKPSCTPTTKTIITTVSSTTRPISTSTVFSTKCRPMDTTVTKTKTETKRDSTTTKLTTTTTITKPVTKTSTTVTTTTKTVTVKPY